MGIFGRILINFTMKGLLISIMGKAPPSKKAHAPTSAPYVDRELTKPDEGLPTMEIDTNMPQSGDDIVSHLLDKKTSDVTIIGLANFLSTPSRRGYSILASTNLLVMLLPRLGVDDSRLQSSEIRQAVLSLYTSVVSWGQEKLLRNLIRKYGLIETVVATLREDMRILANPEKKKGKKSKQRQIDHDSRVEIIEAQWELLAILEVDLIPIGLVRLCAPPLQPVIPDEVVNLALQTALTKEYDIAVRVAAANMLSRVAMEEMCSDCCLSPLTHRMTEVEQAIEESEDALLAAELMSALCHGYHMELFAPERGGLERAQRVVKEMHYLVSSAGAHLVDGFVNVIETVASIQPAPTKGAAADSSPEAGDPAKQRSAQSVVDKWRRSVRLVQTSVTTLSFIASAIVENGRSSSDNAPMSESGVSSSSLPMPFIFSGQAEAYTSVLGEVMRSLAEDDPRSLAQQKEDSWQGGNVGSFRMDVSETDLRIFHHNMGYDLDEIKSTVDYGTAVYLNDSSIAVSKFPMATRSIMLAGGSPVLAYMFMALLTADSSVLHCGLCLSASLMSALDEPLVARVRTKMPVSLLSDLASLWSLHSNALEGCEEIVIVENAVDDSGVTSLCDHCVSALTAALPLFSKLDWGRGCSYGTSIGELLQALYQSLLLASARGCAATNEGLELVDNSVRMTQLVSPLSEDMVQAQVVCISWLGRSHPDACSVCEGLLQLVKLHCEEKGVLSRRVLVATFEAIFEVFGADDNPAADQALRSCVGPNWESLLAAGVRRLKREARSCDEEDVEGAAVNGEAFIDGASDPGQSDMVLAQGIMLASGA
ncbi:hypothetical protein FOL47_004631 [Perkinsus chesapeaki]|uniref:Uncharacterized protein n=1 Tax=Perkinsus chesapeaki TaxID=330153 RepID=A0A7J6M1H4_PERCH|nr:hypothetical protein FOL47_004631 [Perkinsus chesapeaki]